jgi:hypothetical protein
VVPGPAAAAVLALVPATAARSASKHSTNKCSKAPTQNLDWMKVSSD